MQDFVLAAFAPFRVTTPETFVGCHGPNCTGYRMHDFIEYALVPPSNWSVNEPVPGYSPTWKHEFDPSNWDVFQVKNASAIQIEFKSRNVVGAKDPQNLVCEVYGYPYLALEICLAAGSEDNDILIGIHPS